MAISQMGCHVKQTKIEVGMNRQQIAQIYDSMAPEEQNMPKSEFIRKVMNILDPAKNTKILDAMVDRRHQVHVGEMQKAVIDSAITRGK